MAVLPTTFTAHGIQAKQIGQADLDELAAMHQDPLVMAHLGGIRDHATTAEYLQTNMAHWDRHGFGLYAIRDAKSRFVGRAGLRWAEPLGTPEVEVAYALRSEIWGQGHAVAITTRLLELAINASLCAEVIAFTETSNRPSWRVMQKAGFAFDRNFDYAGSPHVLYRKPLTLRDQAVQAPRGPTIATPKDSSDGAPGSGRDREGLPDRRTGARP